MSARTEYSDFAAALTPGGRGGSGARALVDNAPGELDELPGYFLGLDEQRLASCWVACIVSAAIEGEFRIGDLNRVLLVVAERLHGVKLEKPEEFQMSTMGLGKAMSGPAGTGNGYSRAPGARRSCSGARWTSRRCGRSWRRGRRRACGGGRWPGRG